MTEASVNYVIDVLKGIKPLIEPEWFEVLGFLECHRISGLFYSKSKELEINLPHKIDKILNQIFKVQKRRVELLSSNVKEISAKLLKDQVKHVFLKGSVFNNVNNKLGLYQLGERTSNDIDILVNSEEITKISHSLKELGFIQGMYDEDSISIIPFSRKEILERRMNRGEVAPFIKLTNNPEVPFIEVDVNFSLGNTPDDDIKLLDYMIDNSLIINDKFPLTVLDNELFLIQLLMHQYKEATLYFMVSRSKDIDLYKLADIYYLFKNKAFKKTRFKELSKKFKLSQKIGFVLNQVSEAFNDNELKKYAANFKFKEPLIIDYDDKKEYQMTASIRFRLKVYNSRGYLIEKEKKPYYRWEFPFGYFRGNRR